MKRITTFLTSPELLRACVLSGLTMFFAFSAQAHIDMDAPPMRDGNQKSGPCEGLDVGPTRTIFSPGETITVRFRETINHTGHYRIAFDDDGQDDFVNPTNTDDLYNNSTVLLDDIPEENDRDYAIDVTLPNITCENCTLQLIQVMVSGDNVNVAPSNLYFRCADIALRGELGEGGNGGGSQNGDANGGGGDAPGGCNAQGGKNTPMWLAFVGGFFLWARRRQRNPSQ